MTARVGERLFRLLLRLYPRPHRLRFGDEMERTFQELRQSPIGGAAWSGRVLLWLREIRDHLREAIRQRIDGPGAGSSRPVLPGRGPRSPRRHLVELFTDLRFGARSLRAAPGFTAVALAILTLCIGANTAVFSVVQGVLLRPLPFPDPEQLVQVWETDRRQGSSSDPVAPHALRDWQEQTGLLTAVAGYSYEVFGVAGEDRPTRISAGAVSDGFFDVLAVAPALGRTFRPGEVVPGADAVVVLSHQLWQSRFEGDPAVVGRYIAFDGIDREVVGVMPASFRVPDSVQAWVPLAIDYENLNRGSHYLFAIGRLAEGVELEAASAELAGIAARLEEQHPGTDAGHGIRLVPLHEQMVGNLAARLWLMQGAVGLVLLVGCANVGNLLLARAQGRRREIAIRAALGAGRGRVVRQLLTESLLLSLLAAAAGAPLAAAGVSLLVRSSPIRLPRAAELGVDPGLLAIAVGAALATTLVFGLVPSLQLARSGIRQSLREGEGATGGRRGRRLSGVLVAAEVALALVLLVGASLLIGSFLSLEAVDPGFDAAGVLSARIALPESRYGEPGRQSAFVRELVETLEAIPGLDAVGAVDSLPFSGSRSSSSFDLEDRAEDDDRLLQSDVRLVSAGYFDAIGIPLLEGRATSRFDTLDAAPVVVVNRAFARRFLGDRALGERLRIGSPQEASFYGGEAPWRTIVGIVGDIKHDDLTAAVAPEMYVPYEQLPSTRISVVVRPARDADRNPSAWIDEVRAAVLQVDPEQPIYNVSTMRQRLSASIATPRFNGQAIGALALVALALATVGVYGVISYAARQQTRELGLRIALGARGQDVVGLVLRQGMTYVAAGIAVGTVAAMGFAHLLRTLLFEVSAADPLPFAGAAGLLALVALLACLIPARRAARVSPLTALQDG